MLPRLGSSDPLILASGMSHHTQPPLKALIFTWFCSYQPESSVRLILPGFVHISLNLRLGIFIYLFLFFSGGNDQDK